MEEKKASVRLERARKGPVQGESDGGDRGDEGQCQGQVGCGSLVDREGEDDVVVGEVRRGGGDEVYVNANANVKIKGCAGGGSSCCPFQELPMDAIVDSALLVLAIGLGLYSFLYRKWGWIVRFWMLEDDTLISKLSVMLLILHVVSFVRWHQEMLISSELVMAKAFPEASGKVREEIQKCIRESSPALRWWAQSKSLMKVVTIPMTTIVGVGLWDFVWVNYVCKSHRDRSCLKSWIGSELTSYRKEMCYAGKDLNVICDKMIAFLPAIVLTVVVAVMGNHVQKMWNEYMKGAAMTQSIADGGVDAKLNCKAGRATTREKNVISDPLGLMEASVTTAAVDSATAAVNVAVASQTVDAEVLDDSSDSSDEDFQTNRKLDTPVMD